jgi:hypothetical protein
VLVGSGGAEEDHILFTGDEVQRGEVGDGGPRNGGGGEVELLQSLGYREAGLSSASAGVRLLPSGDLSFDEGGKELWGATVGCGP